MYDPIEYNYSLTGIIDFFRNQFGSGSSFSQQSFGGWFGDFLGNTLSIVWVLVIIFFIILFCMVVYTKLRMYELDQEHKARYGGHFIKPQPKATQAKNPRWEHIESLFASTSENDWRVAIIEADTMLDELVTSLGFPGENLGERMKNANVSRFPTIQSAWEAHIVRNKIAHQGINYHLSEREATITKKHFEFVFRDMGII